MLSSSRDTQWAPPPKLSSSPGKVTPSLSLEERLGNAKKGLPGDSFAQVAQHREGSMCFWLPLAQVTQSCCSCGTRTPSSEDPKPETDFKNVKPGLALTYNPSTREAQAGRMAVSLRCECGEVGTGSKKNCQNVTCPAELKQTFKDEGKILNHASNLLFFLMGKCVERC